MGLAIRVRVGPYLEDGTVWGKERFGMAYSAFSRWRSALGSLVPYDSPEWQSDPIRILLDHSDCDGEISTEDCARLAFRLEGMLPALDVLENKNPASGHISGYGGYGETTRRFIRLCREAVNLNGVLDFH